MTKMIFSLLDTLLLNCDSEEEVGLAVQGVTAVLGGAWRRLGGSAAAAAAATPAQP